MSDFDTAIDFILKNEKGLSENPHDAGGITNHGISLRFLRDLSSSQLKNYGIYGDLSLAIKNLTVDQAKAIYKDFFWDVAPFEKILNQDIANYIFDMAINEGIAPAIKCVQRATWSVMKKRVLHDDGILGENTLETIKICGFMLLPALRSERAGFYRLLADKSTDGLYNLEGWLNRAYESQ